MDCLSDRCKYSCNSFESHVDRKREEGILDLQTVSHRSCGMTKNGMKNLCLLEVDHSHPQLPLLPFFEKWGPRTQY